MSNQFNYELDERQVRILMQNAELNYDESAWQKFQAIPSIEQRQLIAIALPKINFGISRSIIVPLFFILMIGGLSALLFSFVDFKKKEEVIKEIPYIAPVTPKKLITPTPVIKKNIAIIPPKKDSSTILITATVAQVATPTVTLVVEKMPTVVEPTKSEEKITANKGPSTGSATKKASTKKENTEKAQPVTKKKKKRRKQITEELPTINRPITNLNEGSKEPELDIK